MASVWKRLQRVNKRAAKFQYTASYHRIDLETTPKWKPNKLSIVWTRRSRRVVTEPYEWEPSLKDPLKGSVIFTAPVNHTVAVTLFKDSRNELEDKDWTFVLEDVSSTGKRRRLAVASINMCKYASLTACQRSLTVTMDPVSNKISQAAIQFTIHCVLLREGHATDEDMQSLASLLSVNNNSDIAVLEDLDEDDYTLSDNSTRQMLDLRQQMEEMTQSLTNSDIAATPNSELSLNFDSRTPVASPDATSPDATSPDATTPVPEDRPKLRPDYLANLTKLAMKPEPKFTSTPTRQNPEIKIEENTDLQPKGVVFKPTTVVKRNLKPLDLKFNLNSGLDGNENQGDDFDDKTPVNDHCHLAPDKFEKDKTPVQELIEWCSAVTRDYHSVTISDLTTSFSDGLAFCAIIHSFRPDLIDFSGLGGAAAEHRVRVARAAGAALGVPAVLSAQEVCRAPDRLAIMTYLFQLRAYFTGNELQVEQLGSDEAESSYMVGRHDTDGDLPPELFTREVSMRRSRRLTPQPNKPAAPPGAPAGPPAGPPSPPAGPPGPPAPPGLNVTQLLVSQSRSFLGKMVARQPDRPSANWFTEPPPTRPEKLMTRKELTDPFGSDEEDETTPPVNGADSDNSKQENNTSPIETQTDPLLNPQPIKDSPATPDCQTDSPPVKQHNSQPVKQVESQTDKQTTGDKSIQTPELPKPTPQLLSRHDELKEKARLLLEATRKEAREKEKNRRQRSKEKEDSNRDANGIKNGELSPGSKPVTDEDRQAILRERARKLIADARAGVISPTSPLSPNRPRAGTVEIITKQSVMDEIAAAGGVEQFDALLRKDSLPSTPGSRKSSASPDRSDRNSEDSKSIKSSHGDEPKKRSPLHSFSAMLDRLTPDKEEPHEKGSYIQSELEALEREQKAIDEKAAALEKQLRRVMENADNSEEEGRLMSQWFNLVNKKNALLRRQMQLNILEQEEDLSRRCELLARELRLSLGVEEWRKTPGQKRRELLLLQDLLSAVNERDRLVQEMDEQERAIADDDEIERNLSQVDMNRKNNCILQ